MPLYRFHNLGALVGVTAFVEKRSYLKFHVMHATFILPRWTDGQSLRHKNRLFQEAKCIDKSNLLPHTRTSMVHNLHQAETRCRCISFLAVTGGFFKIQMRKFCCLIKSEFNTI